MYACFDFLQFCHVEPIETNSAVAEKGLVYSSLMVISEIMKSDFEEKPR